MKKLKTIYVVLDNDSGEIDAFEDEDNAIYYVEKYISDDPDMGWARVKPTYPCIHEWRTPTDLYFKIYETILHRRESNE